MATNPNVLHPLVKVAIPPQNLQAIAASVASLKELLVPFLYDLKPEQLRGMKHPGPAALGFAKDVHGSMTANPELAPAYIDVEEFGRALATLDELMELLKPLAHIVALLKDTIAALGDYIYSVALAYYKSVKTAADLGQPAAAKAVKVLAARFKGQGRRAKPSASTAAPASEVEGESAMDEELGPPAYEE